MKKKTAAKISVNPPNFERGKASPRRNARRAFQEDLTKPQPKFGGLTCDGENWLYSPIVKEHFFHPQNLLIDDANYVADGLGVVGSPACGDVMAVWIKVDTEAKRITECKWRTFGCASAIASTSMMSLMATENGGMTLAKAKRITPEAIIDRLGGLPDRKYHCSVLGHLGLREAIEDYEKNGAGAGG